MLSEKATVISANEQSLQLQTQRKATCSGCSLKSGCGQYLLSGNKDQLTLDDCAYDVLDGKKLRTGDEVMVGLQEGQFLKLTALFYALPIAGLLLFTLMASMAGLSESILILSAITGLVAGFYACRLLIRQSSVQQHTKPTVSRLTKIGETDV